MYLGVAFSLLVGIQNETSAMMETSFANRITLTKWSTCVFWEQFSFHREALVLKTLLKIPSDGFLSGTLISL